MQSKQRRFQSDLNRRNYRDFFHYYDKKRKRKEKTQKQNERIDMRTFCLRNDLKLCLHLFK